jgi:hypothetical protein
VNISDAMSCPAGRRVGETLAQQSTLTLHDDETSLPWPITRVRRVVARRTGSGRPHLVVAPQLELVSNTLPTASAEEQ